MKILSEDKFARIPSFDSFSETVGFNLISGRICLKTVGSKISFFLSSDDSVKNYFVGLPMQQIKYKTCNPNF